MASRKDDFMGGLFDFNGDGKTDLGEEFIAYQIFEDMTNNQKSSEHKTNYVSTLPTNDSGIDKPGDYIVSMFNKADGILLPYHKEDGLEYRYEKRDTEKAFFLSQLVEK